MRSNTFACTRCGFQRFADVTYVNLEELQELPDVAYCLVCFETVPLAPIDGPTHSNGVTEQLSKEDKK